MGALDVRGLKGAGGHSFVGGFPEVEQGMEAVSEAATLFL